MKRPSPRDAQEFKRVKTTMPQKLKAMKHFDRGMTMCYIGNGKGKTTAAVGVAVRARGYGASVLFFQFFKSPDWPSGERKALQTLGIRVEIHGKGFVGILGDRKPKSQHKRAAETALRRAQALIVSGKYALVVLDEVISCIEEGLLTQQDVLKLLSRTRKSSKGKNVHIVLTGHVKYRRILAQCDLVTEMAMVKHPYYKGYLAVKGVDF